MNMHVTLRIKGRKAENDAIAYLCMQRHLVCTVVDPVNHLSQPVKEWQYCTIYIQMKGTDTFRLLYLGWILTVPGETYLKKMRNRKKKGKCLFIWTFGTGRFIVDNLGEAFFNP